MVMVGEWVEDDRVRLGMVEQGYNGVLWRTGKWSRTVVWREGVSIDERMASQSTAGVW